jgi:hypothetical protein
LYNDIHVETYMEKEESEGRGGREERKSEKVTVEEGGKSRL